MTVDVRTNSLLIGGTKRYVELASKVIEDLDSSPAQERITKVYRLRNAQAPAIQAAMQSFLDQEKQRLTSTLGADGIGAAQRMLDREVAVVAEEESNVLLLSASPRYFDTIEALIRELDQPPPQVLIQVLLAEVTLDETTELGVDWNVTSKWNKGHDSAGAGTQFSVAAQGDGFNLSVTAGDLSFFLRALQSQGRLEVLSRPQILASDNQQAMINVGQRVPFITNSRITENGTTINTIEYQNIGIILTVTPRINPDGFVKLEVKPEISSIANSSVTISETTKAIIINQRSAETTVSVQDGHTIILGGLITTKDENRDDRMPWFGDWPIFGPLFRGDDQDQGTQRAADHPHAARGADRPGCRRDRRRRRSTGSTPSASSSGARSRTISRSTSTRLLTRRPTARTPPSRARRPGPPRTRFPGCLPHSKPISAVGRPRHRRVRAAADHAGCRARPSEAAGRRVSDASWQRAAAAVPGRHRRRRAARTESADEPVDHCPRVSVSRPRHACRLRAVGTSGRDARFRATRRVRSATSTRWCFA